MSNPIHHVYVSPHLDDAVCSCGGLIHQQISRGENVLVVTLFSAGIEAIEDLPPYLRALHVVWGYGTTDPFAVRRQEDLNALATLGADHLHLGWRGALYRQSQDGRFLYSGLGYFGRPVQADTRLLVQLRRRLLDLRRQYPEATFYAPLGVGGHVDHRLTHRAARQIPGPMCYYEDVPYVFVGKLSPFVMGVLSSLSRLGVRKNFSGGGKASSLVSIIQSRTALFGGPQLALFSNRAPHPSHWQRVLHPIDLPAKFEAVLAYTSQIPMLFGSSDRAWRSLENYATSIQREIASPMERQWELTPRPATR